ncbi:heavy-metal-associated domain-containing protein [Acidithiobacillus caldus]|jgi:mercuric ion binding protein|uniref:Periplasmic mercuric ion binding protein n=2 Tax=Acidithiobacillus caldus TaxID=33059 RepID=F9ZLF8_ACICS|nr:heavy metal-associated domain-containing protein [Acidithiobacillus caldus]AEK57708.1 periplasmic mercuric ion binding protein [Acidithiobacillus caldus SM-1]AUW32389.1 heavy-metal-associated domain-containing protein [Acidithiobacillus caldus]MBU2782765.1 heavy-metal-associated domain-containing protein [Acidithiobacillus caldus]MBU2791210.1 heavy-metal-associated domain-containing protein [Acidithiobacillus caldus]MBU2820997.1 heavy-metal-associated domain-containing protein [Acidithiobac
MKTLSFSPKSSSWLLATALLFGGAAYMPAMAATSVASHPAYTSTAFKVPSMTCGDKACETAIYIALHRLSGVKKIRIDDATRTVTVMYDPHQVNTAKLLATFRKIGYPATVAHD